MKRHLCFFALMFVYVVTALLTGLATLHAAQVDQLIDTTSPRYRDLFQELEKKYGFSKKELSALFQRVEKIPKVIQLMEKPWEAKPYHTYRRLFLDRQRIEQGKELLALHRELFDRVEKKFGVDREVITAIWGIETRYGRHQGAFDVFRTLNTLFDDYPRRRTFARTQLVNFLLLCRENRQDPHGIMGSYAGAFGQTQFIPSSFRAYAVSFDQDPRRDVWRSIPDVVASIANYLKHHGWKNGAPLYWDIGRQLKDPALVAAWEKGWRETVSVAQVEKGQGIKLLSADGIDKVTVVGLECDPDKGGGMRFVAGLSGFQAITAWNHSNRYAMAVVELAEALAE